MVSRAPFVLLALLVPAAVSATPLHGVPVTAGVYRTERRWRLELGAGYAGTHAIPVGVTILFARWSLGATVGWSPGLERGLPDRLGLLGTLALSAGGRERANVRLFGALELAGDFDRTVERVAVAPRLGLDLMVREAGPVDRLQIPGWEFRVGAFGGWDTSLGFEGLLRLTFTPYVDVPAIPVAPEVVPPPRPTHGPGGPDAASIQSLPPGTCILEGAARP
jgi:hypothetical protein